MAKGYMVFIEGTQCPKVIHPTFEAAMWQLRQLAEKHPGKEVLMFQLQKRAVNKDGVHTPLQCHIPSDFKHPERLTLSRLVYKKELNPTKVA